MNDQFVPFMSKLISAVLFLFSFLLMFSCTRNDAQRDFEKESYARPQGYTETSNQGGILDADPDDWRTSPLFQGLVEIVPPYPNPTTTDQLIEFEVNVTGVNSLNGIQVWTFLDEQTNTNARILYQDFETFPQGLTTFRINPREFAEFGNVEGARGLTRVYIFSGNQQMISYGDIMVE
jgi:hypothetical protein